MARALIAGCGYVGVSLGLRLAEAGHEVYGLRRDPRGLPRPLVPVAADLTDPASLAGLPAGLELVFYMASPTAFTDEAYRAAYVDGLHHLMARVGEARRLVLVTSTGVYGQTDGEWVDETSPTEPTGFSGRRLLEAERLGLAGDVPATVVRLGGIYGPGRTRLLRTVAEGTATLGPTPVYTNRIHREDCAGLLAHIADLEAPDALYLGVDCEPAERGAVLRWLAERLGVAPPARGADGGERQRGGNKRCRNERLLASGYRFAHPTFREGYAELIEAWKGAG